MEMGSGLGSVKNVICKVAEFMGVERTCIRVKLVYVQRVYHGTLSLHTAHESRDCVEIHVPFVSDCIFQLCVDRFEVYAGVVRGRFWFERRRRGSEVFDRGGRVEGI